MKITDYTQTLNTTSSTHNTALETVAATLLLLVPAIMLFLLAK